MKGAYAEFKALLDEGDRQSCLEFALDCISSGRIDIADFYSGILTPALRDDAIAAPAREGSIWQEHVRTSIARTIIECCHPFIIRQRQARGKGRVVIFCPLEEYHEIGARMAMDYFILCGFDALFIGANTPRREITEAIDSAKPDCAGISVSSTFNLVAARKAIRDIRELREKKLPGLTIIAGGNAFRAEPGLCHAIGADLLLQDYKDIKRFAEGG
jgi:methanogenic corrinoid protein MtbC1